MVGKHYGILKSGQHGLAVIENSHNKIRGSRYNKLVFASVSEAAVLHYE